MLLSSYMKFIEAKQAVPFIGVCSGCGSGVHYFSRWDLEFDGVSSKLSCSVACSYSLKQRAKATEMVLV